MADFSNNIVNQRFREVYHALEKHNLIKGKSDIANHLGTYNHVINSILKAQRNITVEQLHKLFEIFHINANYLFGISEDMFAAGYGQQGELQVRSINEKKLDGRRNITLIPDKAIAGYATQLQDPTYLDSLQKFSIPGLEGDLMAFEISGDSMMPNITNGDLVVCEPVERGEPLRDNHIYVVVTDVVVAKRIQQIREGSQVSSLNLISDNSAVFKPYSVDVDEVRQILRVKCRLTTHAIA
ncbi:MAG: S24 family peptidase [Bacteroidota bacterium]